MYYDYANISFTGPVTVARGTGPYGSGGVGTAGYFNTGANDFTAGSNWTFLASDGPAFRYHNVILNNTVVVFQSGTNLSATNITMTGSTLTTVSQNAINLTAGNFTLDSASVITSNGMGYPANTGPGKGTGIWSGGGYGGIGGGTGGGPTYGSAVVPTDLGSGGNGGGAGGGVIVINVTGTLTNNGLITANGDSGPVGDGGGGSGGSIWVTTNTLAGSGSFAANGGDASASSSSGGGGGRIALYYDYANISFTGPVTVARGTGPYGSGGVGTIRWIRSSVPVASFTANITSGTAPLAVQFNDTSTHTPMAWNWSFKNVTPGNNTQTWWSTVRNATQTFGVGNFSIALNSSNSAGYDISTQVTFINVTAAGAAPVASFTSNVTSGTVPLTVQFNETSTNTPTTWNWSFGDGTPWVNITTATLANATHTFSSAGTYTVNLTAGNSAGSNTSSRSNYIVVNPPKPIPAFSGTPTSGTLPLTVSFTDGSLNTTGWAWFFGDENFTAPWTRVNASAGWSARYGHTSVTMPDGSIVRHHYAAVKVSCRPPGSRGLLRPRRSVCFVTKEPPPTGGIQ